MSVLHYFHCRRVRPMLWDFLAERLSEGSFETVERHLEGCRRCRCEAEGMRQTQSFLIACRAEELPAPRSNWHELQTRLLTVPQQAVLRPLPPRVPVPALATGFVGLLLMAAGTCSWRTWNGTQSVSGPTSVVSTHYDKPLLSSNRQPDAPIISVSLSGQTPDDAVMQYGKAPEFAAESRWYHQPAEAHVMPVQSRHYRVPSSEITSNDENTEDASSDVAPVQHRGTPKMPLAANQGKLQFRPYTSQLGDRLQPNPDQDEHRIRGMVEAGNETDDGSYVLPPLRPDTGDDKHPY